MVSAIARRLNAINYFIAQKYVEAFAAAEPQPDRAG